MSTLDDEIDQLLLRHEPAVAEQARRVIGTVRDAAPGLEARVRSGWGSVNFRHPKAGLICAVFPQAKERNVILVFEHGKLLDSPLLTDNGKVRQVRWIPFQPGAEVPADDIAILIAEAVALRA